MAFRDVGGFPSTDDNRQSLKSSQTQSGETLEVMALMNKRVDESTQLIRAQSDLLLTVTGIVAS